MPISFPTSLDNFTNPTPADSLSTPAVLHSTQHANINDAVEALEAKVGIDGSAVTSSHDYKIAQLTSASHAAVTLDANADTVLALSTQTIGLDTQIANRVFAGPTSGGAAVPTFRALVAADIPALSYGDISGTGVVGQVAEFVTNTKTLQAAKIIGPAVNILTITNAAAATLALNITAAKTLTLTAADNYTLTVPESLTVAGRNVANTFSALQTFSNGMSFPVTNIYTILSRTIASNGGNYNGQTIRQTITSASLSNTGKAQTRITFKASTSGGFTITNAYINMAAAAGDVYDFQAAPTQITFNGGSASSGSVAANGSITSDWITFTVEAGKNLVISFYTTPSGFFGFEAISGYSVYTKSGDDASTVDATGYGLLANWSLGVASIESQESVTGGLSTAGILTIANAAVIGGFTATLPASMTLAGRNVANTFTTTQTFTPATDVGSVVINIPTTAAALAVKTGSTTLTSIDALGRISSTPTIATASTDGLYVSSRMAATGASQINNGLVVGASSTAAQSGNTSIMRGAYISASHSGSGSVSILTGTLFQLNVSSAITVTDAPVMAFTFPTNAGTITNLYGVKIGVENSQATNFVMGTVTNAYGVYVNPVSGATTLNFAIYTNAGQVSLLGSMTKASAAGAVWDAIELRAATATITGSTNITTATGFNYHSIAQPTLSAASALTVTNSATFYIANAPTGAGTGPATITNAYALWVDAGLARFDGNGTRVFELPADATGNATSATGRIPVLIGGATKYLRYYDD